MKSEVTAYPNPLPASRLPQKIDSPFADAPLDIDGAGIGLIAGEPAPLDPVIPPLATH